MSSADEIKVVVAVAAVLVALIIHPTLAVAVLVLSLLGIWLSKQWEDPRARGQR